MTHRKLTAVLIIFLLIMVSCKSAPPPHTHILWPVKQGRPMLEYVGSYATSEDFGRNSFDAFIAEITSEQEEVFFRLPFGVSGNTEGDVYVTDQKGVKLINLSRKYFKQILDRKIIRQPSGIAVDDNGRIFVADLREKKVFVLSPAGEILNSFGNEKLFGKPSFIAINKINGNIYVSDMFKHRIATFDQSGNFLFFIGRPGKGPGEFAFPQGITVSSDNQLYVADMLNARIQIFATDGRFIKEFGQQGTDYRDFEAPRDLAFGPDGNLYIVDFKKALLYMYSPDGKMLLVTGDHKRTNNPFAFSSPASIYINGKGAIFITDMMTHRISVWQILTPEYLMTHPID